ncbi:MAG: class I SAM-dependent methyltransferase [Candidatus Levybacteria bacterium]|nr:class I SAM-dependent methyltransferase [Candidatus Levybacteria bacterium]
MSIREAPRFKEPQQFPQNEFTYEWFAKQLAYIKVNRELLRKSSRHLPSQFVFVDIATGTGLVPKLIIEEAQRTNKKGLIIGIDPNTTSLDIARRNIHSTPNVSVKFIPGLGQNLKQLLKDEIPDEGVNGVSILDALHEIRDDKDKQTVLQSMADILKPGGVFTCNSAFTTEAICKSPRVWSSWKLTAIEILGKERDRKAPKMAIHSSDTYRKMVKATGLEIDRGTTKTVMLSRKALKAISKYPTFIMGIFEDMIGQEQVSLRDKSNALIEALRKQKIIAIPRVWSEIIALKPSNSVVKFG